MPDKLHFFSQIFFEQFCLMDEVVLIILFQYPHTVRIRQALEEDRCGIDCRRDIGKDQTAHSFGQPHQPFLPHQGEVLVIDGQFDPCPFPRDRLLRLLCP